ncbi:TPA: hypothetical protein ACG2XD_003725 [Proteus mirabilis]
MGYNVNDNEKGLRTSLRIPKRIARIIEEVINHRIDNEEDELPINRSAVAIEMMGIGALVLKKGLKDDSQIQKAYSKEFEIVIKLLLTCEHFARMTATNTGETDYNVDSPELVEIRQRIAEMAKNLLP